MADALNDEFYMSGSGDESEAPRVILQGEEDESVEYQSGQELETSATTTSTTAQPVTSSSAPSQSSLGHSIHPDRMIHPSLKRHVDESTPLSTTASSTKKQKKLRVEEPIPNTADEQLIMLQKLYSKCKKPTVLETDNVMSLTAEHVVDTEFYRGNLQSYIQASVPNWEKVLTKQFNKGKGHPNVIILTTSAVRCISLIRDQLPHLHRIHPVTKLFAKHYKLSDHIEMLKKAVVRIAVGTPGRVLDLQKEESMDLLKVCGILVLDMSKDGKMQNVITLDGCKEAVFELLDLAVPRIVSGDLKLMFKF